MKSNARRMGVGLAVGSALVLAYLLGSFVAGSSDAAPAPYLSIRPTGLSNADHGMVADLDAAGHAIAVATRRSDGSLDIECTDHETAARMVAGAIR